ncbi:gluconolaconase [Stenotrophomonas rhizophila]|uniref:gluconolaconase n=1 Tax=Stenotrophomonas rhizophila TaxID=216778 RepID=UPI001E2E506F|nr:gluconolaconase [Stenotrophomonas rhizophila]MCC7634165.1 gluconolaconase [Stenotrophomonas rhizophila]MCC7662861.1 gluconolaconase [Stenotrophomonas rhizophila]
MGRSAWVVVIGVATLALLAWTFLHEPGPPPPPPAPAATALGWNAQIDSVAGDGVGGLLDAAMPGQARFADPYGLAVGADGVVYIADAGDNNRIRRLHPDGRVDTLAGQGEGWRDGPALQAQFNTPSGIAVDAAGTVYVADTGNNVIRAVAPDGQVRTLAGDGQRGFADGPAAQARFDAPMGVAVGRDGRVFVADTYNDRIRVIEPDGQVRTLAGGAAPGLVDGVGQLARLDTPVAVVLDHHGRLLIADLFNNAVRRLDTDGSLQTVVADGGVLSGPLSVAVTFDDVLYVSDVNGKVVQVSAHGHQVALAGVAPQPRFSRPTALALDGRGGLYLADAASYRVHRLRPLAATATAAPALIGPAPQAPLPATAGRWPLAPQDGWHEVVGTLGEVRGTFSGESRHHLHDGFDVRGDVGQTVLAVAAGKVSSPAATWSVGGQAEGMSLDRLRYIHMKVGRDPRDRPFDARWPQVFDDEGKLERVRVRRGTRFAAGDALGSINRMAHVHLSVGASGFERNAVALGFTGYADAFAPRITGVELLDDLDQPLAPGGDGRVAVPRLGPGVQIVVEAWDQVDRNLPRRRLGAYQVGYQILDARGQPLPGYEQPRFNIVFNRMPRERSATLVAYAPDSGITVHGSALTRFRYLVTNTVRDGLVQTGRWQPDALPAGDYLIRASVRDYSGNEGVGARELKVTLLP